MWDRSGLLGTLMAGQAGENEVNLHDMAVKMQVGTRRAASMPKSIQGHKAAVLHQRLKFMLIWVL